MADFGAAIGSLCYDGRVSSSTTKLFGAFEPLFQSERLFTQELLWSSAFINQVNNFLVHSSVSPLPSIERKVDDKILAAGSWGLPTIRQPAHLLFHKIAQLGYLHVPILVPVRLAL